MTDGARMTKLLSGAGQYNFSLSETRKNIEKHLTMEHPEEASH